MCSPFPRARMGSIFVQLLNYAPTGSWARAVKLRETLVLYRKRPGDQIPGSR